MKCVINIDISLVKRYAGSKQRKELFALALGCHIMRTNGVIFNFDRFLIRNKFHVGKAKAIRLYEDAQNDWLFTFHGDSVSVGSFRCKDIKINRKGKKYRSAFVHKFEFDTEYKYTLKELYNAINEILALYPISAKEKDCLLQGGGLDNRFVQNIYDAKSRTLTLKKLSQNVKMSGSSTSRIIKNLVEDKRISKEPARLYTAIDSEHINEIKECLQRLGRRSSTFEHGGLTYILVPSSYSVIDRGVTNSFHHKIYGYHSSNGRNNISINNSGSTVPQLNDC
jgi:hypothetical protein